MMQLVARTYLACGRCDSLQRAEADRIELVVQGNTEFVFDDIRVMTRSADTDQSLEFTYVEFWGHNHLIRGEDLQSTACNQARGIKYHVPRTHER